MTFSRVITVRLLLVALLLPMFSTSSAQPSAACFKGLDVRLIPSEEGRVTAEDGLTLYEMPTRESEAITRVEVQSEFVAWYGPSCTDDAVWWLVDADNTFGWLMENAASNQSGEDAIYWVEPVGRSAEDILPERPRAGDGPVSQESLGIEFMLSANVSTAADGQWVLPGEMENNAAMYENPLYREIRFPGYVGSEKDYWLFIRVHKAADWEEVIYPLDDLRSLLQDQPETPYLTGLPRINAGMMFEANLSYLDFQNGSGIRGLAHFSQFGGPPGDGEVLYMFSGLTDDEAYLVQIVFPIDSVMLPDSDVIFQEFNYEAWPAWPRDDRLFRDGIVMMFDAAPDSLTVPRLSDLDALVESLFIGDPPPLCAGMPSRLQIGNSAIQILDNDPLRVRDTPNGATIESLYPGETVIIADGPECVNDVVWWQVVKLNKWVGWVAEVQGEDYYLAPSKEQE